MGLGGRRWGMMGWLGVEMRRRVLDRRGGSRGMVGEVVLEVESIRWGKRLERRDGDEVARG